MAPADTAKQAKSKSKKVVADSWEDEDVSDEEVQEEPAPEPSASETVPATLSDSNFVDQWSTTSAPTTGASLDDSSSARRPEKTDAVARRMIAAGLGLRAPKQTEEQKAYQKSIREQERKKKEQEKLEAERQRELAEKAKAAVWDG